MKKILSLILVLIMSLLLVACGSVTPEETPLPSDGAPTVSDEAPFAGVSFTVIVKTLDGSETTFEYTSNAESVGAALQEEGLLVGEMGEYGLYIKSVNGVVADWDTNQTYWAFYVNGEYALAGVDLTEITPGATYTFEQTKG